MVERQETETFQDWLDGLRSDQAVARIVVHVDRLVDAGHGDVKYLGEKLNELRIHHGPGYRVYFARVPDYLLLFGGTKDTQERDIRRARRLLKEILDARGNDGT
ncbi:MAG: type II toxin-antitoxin system RelE/ParE family toxin [Boseongicola sp.]|nr:type II toxin-antitoxin system RelE/ParE family toxin [Boseongicola sp.]